MRKDVFQIHQGKDSPFVVGKNQTYKIVPLGYVDKSNPSGDTIFDPADIDRVKITKKGDLSDGSQVFIAHSECDCGVNIEVLD